MMSAIPSDQEGIHGGKGSGACWEALAVCKAERFTQIQVVTLIARQDLLRGSTMRGHCREKWVYFAILFTTEILHPFEYCPPSQMVLNSSPPCCKANKTFQWGHRVR